MLDFKLSRRDKMLIATGETSGFYKNISSTLTGFNISVHYLPLVDTGVYSYLSP
jgi:hypothetical protein